MNYDASQVGVPYVRTQKITINYPDAGVAPSAVIEQSLAVRLADGTSRMLEAIAPLCVTFDFATNGTTPIPLVSPDNGAVLGPSIDLQTVMLGILAVVRSEQLKAAVVV
jgi:hypothetical protein